MVSKKTIKGYDFETKEQYFEYIVDSIINGQRQQAKNLIKELSKRQKKEAIEHIKSYESNAKEFGEAIQMIFNTL